MFTQHVSSRSSSSQTARPQNINVNLRLLAAGVATGAVALFATPTAAASLERCASRGQQWRYLSAVRGRQLCANILRPEMVQMDEDNWFVAVHVDRAPTVALETRPRAGNLRGSRDKHPRQPVATRRGLPHQYFVRAMEVTLNAISRVEPAANVDVVVFSEGRWGEMVDEQGVSTDWNIGSEICEELGLQCSQVRSVIHRLCVYSWVRCEYFVLSDVWEKRAREGLIQGQIGSGRDCTACCLGMKRCVCNESFR